MGKQSVDVAGIMVTTRLRRLHWGEYAGGQDVDSVGGARWGIHGAVFTDWLEASGALQWPLKSPCMSQFA